MTRHPRRFAVIVLLTLSAGPFAVADEAEFVKSELAKPALDASQTLKEVEDYCESLIPTLPKAETAEQWARTAESLRRRMLDEVVFRGEAKAWRGAKTRIVWLDSIPGGPGYTIRKLRYEALPDFWIPALLYVPDQLEGKGKVPVALNVNGHDPNGKAADYKQIRCINQAKRGMIALNPEWLNMGQFRKPGYGHGMINHLDLCGTSGIAVFHLAMTRALDVLLSLEHADPSRVLVTGLSGGGWQTIFVSALDPRVTMSIPVAGYSSFRTRARHHSDLGDSEQTPSDMATVADYTHFTAMLAPRPALLVYNANDNCCFKADHALPPLLDAARPIYKLFEKESLLDSHINRDPGDHNYLLDNRQAHYRKLGKHFFADQAGFDPKEIPSDKEVKTAKELDVPLPDDTLDISALAKRLSRALPKGDGPPATEPNSEPSRFWRSQARGRLQRLLSADVFEASAAKKGEAVQDGVKTTHWRIKAGPLTIPAVEIVKADKTSAPKGVTILIADSGRKSLTDEARNAARAGRRVIAVDPYLFGEQQAGTHEYLFPLLIASGGKRPLAIQAAQLNAVAKWAGSNGQPVEVSAIGPRTTTIALVAAAIDESAIASLRLSGAMTSFKTLIDQGTDVSRSPESFAFGLLEEFDIFRLKAMAAPRPIAE